MEHPRVAGSLEHLMLSLTCTWCSRWPESSRLYFLRLFGQSLRPWVCVAMKPLLSSLEDEPLKL